MWHVPFMYLIVLFHSSFICKYSLFLFIIVGHKCCVLLSDTSAVCFCFIVYAIIRLEIKFYLRPYSASLFCHAFDIISLNSMDDVTKKDRIFHSDIVCFFLLSGAATPKPPLCHANIIPLLCQNKFGLK